MLMVSPHFPPTNAADHQRVRMSLPYLKHFGWEATVLAIQPHQVEGGVHEPLLNDTVPESTKVIRTGALPAKWTRRLGLGNFALRALPYLWREGTRTLVGGNFDLIYFSTTMFPVMSLGPHWWRRFRVPYVVDFQDPWLDDYYERTATPPPGGRLRYRLSRLLAKQLEPRVMRDVAHATAVSPAYVETLRVRYPDLREDQFTVLPFGAPEKDFELLAGLKLKQRIFDQKNGIQHWLYIGRGGHNMAAGLRLLFASIAQEREQHSDGWKNIRLHFAGTSYAPEGRGEKTVEKIASKFGVADIVDEITDRLPYFETLQALTEADALLVVGSDSPSYTASKLYPYILAERPMLSVLHEKSPAVEMIRKCNAGVLVTFDPAAPERSAGMMQKALEGLLEDIRKGRKPALDREYFAPYTAREMTGKLCAVFDRVVAEPKPEVSRS